MASGDFDLDTLLRYLRYETKDIIPVLQQELTELGYELKTDNDNYIVAIPGTINDDNHPRLCFVAHMDTVTRTGVNLVVHNGRVTNAAGVLGADDRAGVFAIMETIKHAPYKPIVVFTNYEETGGRGVKELCRKDVLRPYLDRINMFLEPDRKGWDEYVFYSHSLPKKIAAFVERHGFRKEHGSYSDVCDLTKKYYLPHVNLCVGYMWQHTRQEHLDLIDLRNVMRQMARMLASNIPRIVMTEEEVNGPKYNTNTSAWTTRGGSTSNWSENRGNPKKKGFRGVFNSYEEYQLARAKFKEGEASTTSNSKSQEQIQVQGQAPQQEVNKDYLSKSPDDWDSNDWLNWENSFDAEVDAIRAGSVEAVVENITKSSTSVSPTQYMDEKNLLVDGELISPNQFIELIQSEIEAIETSTATVVTK